MDKEVRDFFYDLELLLNSHVGKLSHASIAGLLLQEGAEMLRRYAPNDKTYELCINEWYERNKESKG